MLDSEKNSKDIDTLIKNLKDNYNNTIKILTDIATESKATPPDADKLSKLKTDYDKNEGEYQRDKQSLNNLLKQYSGTAIQIIYYPNDPNEKNDQQFRTYIDDTKLEIAKIDKYPNYGTDSSLIPAQVTCKICNKIPQQLFVCAKCQAAPHYYCGAKCQNIDWYKKDGHGSNCKGGF